MRLEYDFTAEVWEWRGPAPFYFASMPEEASEEISSLKAQLSYGWGAIPAVVKVGETEATTSIFSRAGRYIVPLKDALRRPEGIEPGDDIHIYVTLEVRD